MILWRMRLFYYKGKFPMNYKVFVQVFFEKSKYFIMYSLAIITFWYALFVNVSSVATKDYYEKKVPDIEVHGVDAGTDNRYMMYRNLDASTQNKYMEKEMKSYGLTVRNLFSFSDAYYSVSYRIYGADNEFINELEDYVNKGRLPAPGKTEAVIGSNVAKYYKLKVGDTLDLPITLEEDAVDAYRKYIVSGIIIGEASYFSDGIYISKDTFESLEHTVSDNVIYMYTKNDTVKQNMLEKLEQRGALDGVGGVLNHAENKVSLQKTIRNSLIITVPFSIIVLSVLFVSLMKYMGKKIALMKAIGISDGHIMKMLMKGFAVCNVTGMLLSFLSLGLVRAALGFSLPVSVILYSVYSFAIIFVDTMVILFIMCKRISPRLVMYRY